MLRSCKHAYSFRSVSEFALKRLSGEFDLESITVLDLSGKGKYDTDVLHYGGYRWMNHSEIKLASCHE